MKIYIEEEQTRNGVTNYFVSTQAKNGCLVNPKKLLSVTDLKAELAAEYGDNVEIYNTYGETIN